MRFSCPSSRRCIFWLSCFQCALFSPSSAVAEELLNRHSGLGSQGAEGDVRRGAQKKPNIVLIVADDLGWADTQVCASSESLCNVTEMRTPYLKNLASESVVFDRMYVAPQCSPSRAQLLTGRYAHRYGLQNLVIQNGFGYGLNINETLLPQDLSKLGYTSRMVGKWHLGFPRWENTPTYRGFESFFGYYAGEQSYFTKDCKEPTIYIPDNDVPVHGFDFREDSKPNCGANCSRIRKDLVDEYNTPLFTNKAVDIINTHHYEESPLFLYLSLQSVHSPQEVPQSYVQPFANKSSPLYIKDRNRRVFAGMISAMDESVGGVVDALKARGVLEDTIVIFMSDNGGATSDFFGDSYIGSNNSPLRGDKATLFEGGVRSVSFMKAPGLTPGHYSGLLSEVDLYATLLEAAGGAVMPSRPGFPTDSLSFWPALHGKSTSQHRNETVFLQESLTATYQGAPLLWSATIITDSWKLIYGYAGLGYDYYPLPDSGEKPSGLQNLKCIPGCLYNLQDDPIESKSVFEDHPDIVDELMNRLKFYNQSWVMPYWPTYKWDDQADPRHFHGTWTPYLSTDVL